MQLSYRDSLGVAVVTQAQSYDPWSNVLAGTEYSSNVNGKDKYLVSGKETDSETGNILLDWRDYDSTTGRMNSFDPADQSVSISGYAYCGNNPVSYIDPDGREFFTLLAIALFSGHVAGTINVGTGGNYGKGFLSGFTTSMIGGGVGSGMTSLLGPANTLGGAILRGAAGGLVAGGLTGGIGSAMDGGSFWKGALSGGTIGGISGGIMSGGDFLHAKALFNATKARLAGVNSLQPKQVTPLLVKKLRIPDFKAIAVPEVARNGARNGVGAGVGVGISNQGIDFIRGYEQFIDHIYMDQGGFPTIGIGHLIQPGETFPETITRARGEALFTTDITVHAHIVNNNVRVPLSQNQYDALASFAYNVGETTFRNSTLLRQLNAGNYETVPQQLNRFVYTNGIRSQGLINRRASEVNIWVNGNYNR